MSRARRYPFWRDAALISGAVIMTRGLRFPDTFPFFAVDRWWVWLVGLSLLIAAALIWPDNGESK